MCVCCIPETGGCVCHRIIKRGVNWCRCESCQDAKPDTPEFRVWPHVGRE